jgi:cytochrome c-type biogenesis protein CcmH
VTLWIAMGALTAVVLGLLLRPLLRPLRAEAAAPPAALAIYRDQLAEAEREMRAGDVSADEAETARRVIARRLLAAAAPPSQATSAPPRRAIALALLLLLPASALALYLWLGQPELPAQPLSGRGEEIARATALKAEITAAAAAVKADAEDPVAWRRLGIALVLAGESQAAIDAIQTALTLGQPLGPAWESETWAMLAGAIMERRGETPPMARQALARALELDPDNLLALYLTGVVLRQDGRLGDALDLWRYVEATGGDSLPFRALLEAAIREAEAALREQPAPG